MSDTTYTRWYHTGTISIAKNSTTLTGSNTYWLNAGIKSGDLFTVDDSKFYEVSSIDSNLQITLCKPYDGDTLTNSTYSIIRNFTATLPAEIAAKTVEVLVKHNRYIDEDMKTVQGKSAYDIACEQGYSGSESDWLDTLNAYGVARKNGYTGDVNSWLESLTAYGRAKDNGFSGTESEWLESLIGANEWATLNERTKQFINDGVGTRLVWDREGTYAPLHNSIARGKYLGDHITDEQWKQIKDGTFEDMWLGDFWDFGGSSASNAGTRLGCNGNRFFIACFNPGPGRENGTTSQSYTNEVVNIPGTTPSYLPPKPKADLTHIGGALALVDPYDHNFMQAGWVSGDKYTLDQKAYVMNPLDGSNPQPYYSCEGRNNPEYGFYRKKEFMKEFFGEDHLLYYPHVVVSAFDEETQEPAAFKTIYSYYEVLSMANFFGYYPPAVKGHEIWEANCIAIQRRVLPLFKHVNYSPLAQFREQLGPGAKFYGGSWAGAVSTGNDGKKVTILTLR